jgi:tetratricopeptide (TPR) repeat protein
MKPWWLGFFGCLATACLASIADPVFAQSAKEKSAAVARVAAVMLELGKAEQGLDLFRKAYKLDPEPALLGQMARIYDKQRDLAGARGLYERWVQTETDPDKIALAKAGLADVLDRLTGNLVVSVVPASATVLVDGLPTRVWPGVEIKRGTHELEVSQAGYVTTKRTFAVLPGGETRLTVKLQAIPGRLAVHCNVAGAKFMLDDADAKPLPLEQPLVLLPGRHDVRVTAEGYEAWTRVVEIGPDSELSIEANLVALAKDAEVPSSVPAAPPVAAPKHDGPEPDESQQRFID